MAKKKSESLENNTIEDLFLSIEKRLNLAESLHNFTRVRILMLLWAYKEQSVKDLCDKLGKSWPTVNRNLTVLIEAGVIDVRGIDSPGPKKKKLYSLKPDILMRTRIMSRDVQDFPVEKVKNLYIKGFESDGKTIETVKNVMEDIIPYFQDLQTTLSSEPLENHEDLQKFMIENRVSYYIEALDEEEFKIYLKKYSELYNEMVVFRKKRLEELKGEKVKKPHIVFHTIIPIKKIQEARIQRFW